MKSRACVETFKAAFIWINSFIAIRQLLITVDAIRYHGNGSQLRQSASKFVWKMFKNNNVVPTVVVVGAASILTVVGAYFYQRRKKNQIPTEWTPVGKVVNLYLYPLKSGRAIELNEAQCTDVGVTQTYEESKTLQLSDR